MSIFPNNREVSLLCNRI